MREETQGVAYFCVEPTAGFKASKALDFAAEKCCGQMTMRIIATLQRGPRREGCSVGEGEVWPGIRCFWLWLLPPSWVQVSLKEPPISTTVDVSTAIRMAITLATSSAEGSDWGRMWCPTSEHTPEEQGALLQC